LAAILFGKGARNFPKNRVWEKKAGQGTAKRVRKQLGFLSQGLERPRKFWGTLRTVLEGAERKSGFMARQGTV